MALVETFTHCIHSAKAMAIYHTATKLNMFPFGDIRMHLEGNGWQFNVQELHGMQGRVKLRNIIHPDGSPLSGLASPGHITSGAQHGHVIDDRKKAMRQSRYLDLKADCKKAVVAQSRACKFKH